MSRSLGPTIPEPLREVLDGTRLAERASETIILTTTDEDGWPSIALLSVGEVLAVEPGRLRIALWTGTGATDNLSRTGQGTLAYIERTAWYVTIETVRGPDFEAGGQQHAFFECYVREALEDRVSYAQLEAGIRFSLVKPETALPRWEATIATLRDLDVVEWKPGAPDRGSSTEP